MEVTTDQQLPTIVAVSVAPASIAYRYDINWLECLQFSGMQNELYCDHYKLLSQTIRLQVISDNSLV